MVTEIALWKIFRYDIVEGENSLWDGVSKPYRETIRAFLAYFQNQVQCRLSFCFLVHNKLTSFLGYSDLPLYFYASNYVIVNLLSS